MGDAPAAPLDDLAAKGGSAANAQQLATRTFGFPLATDTAVVQRDPRGLSDDAQRRQVDAALAVRDHRDQALAPIRAAVPISNANVRTPSGERGTTAVTYLAFAPDASLADDTAAAQHYARRPSAGHARRSSASPARRRRATRSSTRSSSQPLIEAASVVLIALIVGLAFRLIGAPLVALTAAGSPTRLRCACCRGSATRERHVPKEIEPVVVVLLLGL